MSEPSRSSRKVRKVDQRNISKLEFWKKLAEKTGIEEKICEKIFIKILDLMIEEVQEGNRIEFRNYFILGSKFQDSRMAQNPRTLEQVEIPPRRMVYFKKGNLLDNMKALT